jgi:transposase
VIELDRPWRAKRRDGGKSDSIDALRAAREALARTKLAEPRSRGERAALAVLLVARRSAVQGSTDAVRQLQNLVMTAPEALAVRFRGLSTAQMLKSAARLRVDPSGDAETSATTAVLRSLARRAMTLQAEAKVHANAITAVVCSVRPELLEVVGVGPIVAAVVLCAWSHPGRCRSEAA